MLLCHPLLPLLVTTALTCSLLRCVYICVRFTWNSTNHTGQKLTLHFYLWRPRRRLHWMLLCLPLHPAPDKNLNFLHVRLYWRIVVLSFTCHVEDRAKCHALAGNVNGIGSILHMSYIHTWNSSFRPVQGPQHSLVVCNTCTFMSNELEQHKTYCTDNSQVVYILKRQRYAECLYAVVNIILWHSESSFYWWMVIITCLMTHSYSDIHCIITFHVATELESHPIFGVDAALGGALLSNWLSPSAV